MGKQRRIKGADPACKEQRPSHEKKKTNSRPKDLDVQEIPFKLREIMKSRLEMKQPKKKRKRRAENQGAPSAPFPGDIPVPKFKRKKRESVGAYLGRMNRETQHVIFLSKNQVERKPEEELEGTEEGVTQKEGSQKEKSQRKKNFEKRKQDRILRKKEEKNATLLEKDIFRDTVKFGEVVMEPPSFTVKPRKSTVKNNPGEKQLLLKKLFDKGTAPPVLQKPAVSLARQRLIQEERERVVQAYRDLKKRKQQQQDTERRLSRPRKRERRSIQPL
ncbi:hypothetical protein FKM82_007890 [Ascaphus truei]